MPKWGRNIETSWTVRNVGSWDPRLDGIVLDKSGGGEDLVPGVYKVPPPPQHAQVERSIQVYPATGGRVGNHKKFSEENVL